MFTDWTHWLSSMRLDELALLLAPLLLFDAPRYSIALALMCLCDMISDLCNWFWRGKQPDTYSHSPSVTLVVVGLNEGATVGATLASAWGTYPRLKMIVVDDGSSDDMADVAQDFARRHAHVLVLKKAHRGGKSSALNFALPFVQTEIIVCVDGDSHLEESAIWEIVQPFADPEVGAVSGCITARNAFFGLLTQFQAFEYLRCIFLGRMLSSRLDVMNVISGAFGAFRRDALERAMGWDVGPGEDGDLTLRLRKAGYRIAFQPYAQCFTNVPTTIPRLIHQRRRWNWSTIRYECRKHVDLGNPFHPRFRLSNLTLLLDCWLFNVLAVYALWAYLGWMVFHYHEDTWKQILLYYLACIPLDLILLCVALYYSTSRWRDLCIGLCLPLNPIYGLFLKAVSLLALTEEMLTRPSFRDNFVPEHVRQATWHW